MNVLRGIGLTFSLPMMNIPNSKQDCAKLLLYYDAELVDHLAYPHRLKQITPFQLQCVTIEILKNGYR